VTSPPPPSGADLTITWDAQPKQVCTATRCTLRGGRARIHNTGDLVAAASRVRFYLSNDATLDAGDVLLRDRGVPKIRPGKDRTKNLGTVALDASAIGKFVIAVADATGVVAESDETNDVGASAPIAGM